ncbi:hypothetical protein [Photobacterium leiognathi]|uniref:hypothetical protein n=1 Tax=Photobacterium leiognathi TaxID=553611 RepID=UPI002980F88F|nr:hypothetical protein [Photobacterium leiognathi]
MKKLDIRRKIEDFVKTSPSVRMVNGSISYDDLSKLCAEFRSALGQDGQIETKIECFGNHQDSVLITCTISVYHNALRVFTPISTSQTISKNEPSTIENHKLEVISQSFISLGVITNTHNDTNPPHIDINSTSFNQCSFEENRGDETENELLIEARDKHITSENSHVSGGNIDIESKKDDLTDILPTVNDKPAVDTESKDVVNSVDDEVTENDVIDNDKPEVENKDESDNIVVKTDDDNVNEIDAIDNDKQEVENKSESDNVVVKTDDDNVNEIDAIDNDKQEIINLPVSDNTVDVKDDSEDPTDDILNKGNGIDNDKSAYEDFVMTKDQDVSVTTLSDAELQNVWHVKPTKTAKTGKNVISKLEEKKPSILISKIVPRKVQPDVVNNIPETYKLNELINAGLVRRTATGKKKDLLTGEQLHIIINTIAFLEMTVSHVRKNEITKFLEKAPHLYNLTENDAKKLINVLTVAVKKKLKLI